MKAAGSVPCFTSLSKHCYCERVEVTKNWYLWWKVSMSQHNHSLSPCALNRVIKCMIEVVVTPVTHGDSINMSSWPFELLYRTVHMMTSEKI